MRIIKAVNTKIIASTRSVAHKRVNRAIDDETCDEVWRETGELTFNHQLDIAAYGEVETLLETL